MEHKWHYHVLLLVNKDAYGFLGDYRDINNQNNFLGKIRKAWCSAINGDYELCAHLVHVPENPIYYLDSNDADFNAVYSDLIYRVSYIAKDATKPYGDGNRCFGCSQR